jgi:hypothetical protein
MNMTSQQTKVTCAVDEGLPLRPFEGRRIDSDWGEHNIRSLEPSICLDSYGYGVHPYFKSFKEIDWSIFGTLTWERASRRSLSFNSELLRQKDFNGLLQVACQDLGIRRKHLPYYHAMEWTDANEAHYHFLLARDNRLKVSPDELSQYLQEQWTKTLKPYGCKTSVVGEQAVVRPYDQAQGLAGVSYCLKRDSEFYSGERERFDVISPALMKLLCKNLEPSALALTR